MAKLEWPCALAGLHFLIADSVVLHVHCTACPQFYIVPHIRGVRFLDVLQLHLKNPWLAIDNPLSRLDIEYSFLCVK